MIKALITGGTGSIGQALVHQMSQDIEEWDIAIFSRHEADLVSMHYRYPQYKYIAGDVSDDDEVFRATIGMNYVFHLAALKHVDICEQQSMEAILINEIGTMNVINACLWNECRMVNMSSDKAINPANVYGRTKANAEAMVRQAGFVSVRSGNVLWSSASVLPRWKEQLKEKNCIELTDGRMTRFFIHPAELTRFMLKVRDEGGVQTVPMRAFRLIDIAEEFVERFGNAKSEVKITGLRLGERLHEYRDENTSSENNICTDMNYIFE